MSDDDEDVEEDPLPDEPPLCPTWQKDELKDELAVEPDWFEDRIEDRGLLPVRVPAAIGPNTAPVEES